MDYFSRLGWQPRAVSECVIVREWKYEVSTIAHNDLQQKQWNKPTSIPLAEDLKLLKSYLIAKNEVCGNALQQDLNKEKAFKQLVEVTHVQLLLLNRRRIGELQSRVGIIFFIEYPWLWNSCLFSLNITRNFFCKNG